MALADTIIKELEEARAATDAYAKKHGLDKKYENPRYDVEDDRTFRDFAGEEDALLLDLCEAKHATDDEFFRTIEYLMKMNSRFTGLAIGDLLARHLKRRKTFRRKRKA